MSRPSCCFFSMSGVVPRMVNKLKFSFHVTRYISCSCSIACGTKRVLSTDELPSGIIWAVGGVGLLSNYNPTAEGFCKCTANGKTEDFSDVIKTNNHSMLGYKQGYMYLVYCSNMSGAQVNDLAKKLGFEKAIMLDGGHVAGINGTEDFAKINTKSTPQYYIIQAIT